MKKFLIAKLVSLMLMGTCYAIQRPEKTCSISPSILSQTPAGLAGVRTPLSQEALQTVCRPTEKVATRKSRKIPGTTTSTNPSYATKETDGGETGTPQPEIRLWSLPGEIHSQRPTRSRPLSSNREATSLTAQQLQLCFGAPERFPKTLYDGSEVSAKVGRLAQAIARTEGYCQVGTLPNRY